MKHHHHSAGREPHAWAVWVVPAIGVFVFALALWAQARSPVGVFYDDGIYVTLAKALAEGAGYHNIHLPGAPAAVHYPILYPAALSLLWRIWPAFPANVVLFQLFDAAALGVAAWLVARHAARWDLPLGALLATLVAGFAAFPLLTIVGVRFSEPLFLALGAGAILLADRGFHSRDATLAALVLAALATLTRSIGIAMVIGIAIVAWRRGARRQLVLGLGAAAALLVPWGLWVAMHTAGLDPHLAANYGSYVTDVGQSGIRGVIAGLDFRSLSPMLRLTLPTLPGVLWYPLAAGLLAAVATGAWRVRHHSPALVASLAAYLGMVTLWPHRPDRFIWIVFPWLALLAVTGALAAARRGRGWRVAGVVIALAVAAGYPRREAISLATRGFARTAEGIGQSFEVLLPSLRDEIPPDAVIASADEALVYLYAGRHAVPSYLFDWSGRGRVWRGVEDAFAFYCHSGVTHVALTGPGEDAAPLVLDLVTRGVLDTLFALRDGPSLYRLRCPA